MTAVATEKSTLHIMDATGDTRIMWDPANQDEVATARAAFNAAKEKGMVAYTVDNTTGESSGEVIHKFDPRQGKIIMAPQLVGG